MGALTRVHDWSATPVGLPGTWSQSLKTSVRLVLSSGHPMLVWWGPELIQFYNDAYIPSLVPDRHPGALGQPGRECWPETWDVIGPEIEQVMAGGGPTWHENQFVPVIRNGQLQDAYWTYSFNPIDDPDAPNGVGGVLLICQETTGAVLAEQRRVADAERQRRLFKRAPGFITILRGPDLVFEFVNDAYDELFGRRGFVGRTVREMFPDIASQGFFELLDKAYATGERFIARHIPISLQNLPGAPAEDRFLDFIYEPMRDEQGLVTGLFIQGHDVTAAHLAYLAQQADGRRQALQIALDDALRHVSDPRAMMAAAAGLLGRHLGAARCGYAELDEAGQVLTITDDWTDGTMPSAAGRYLCDAFGSRITAELRQGRTVRIEDAAADPRIGPEAGVAYEALGGLRAVLAAPLVEDGRWVASMFVNAAAPRCWTGDDEALLLAAAGRTWMAVKRVRAETASRDSAARLAAALAVANLGTFEYDLVAETVALDARSREIFGFKDDAAVSVKAVYDRIDPADLDRILAEVQASRRDLSRWETEYRVNLPDGGARVVLSTHDVVAGPDGLAARALGVLSDVTERRWAEVRLQQLNATLEQQVEQRTRTAKLAEARFRGIFDSACQMIGLVALDGAMLEVNRAALDAAGIELAGAVGLPIWDAPWFRGTPASVALLKDALPAVAMGRPLRTELDLLLPDQRMRTYDFSLSPVHDDQGQVAFIVAEGHDVTGRKQLEAQFRQSHKMEAVGQLTGGIAHDFNNMLQGIGGAVELLRLRVEQGRVAEAGRLLDAAQQGVARAASLTQRLLAFSRQQTLQPRAVEPDTLVLGMEDLIRRTVGPGIEVKLGLHDGIWSVLCDPNQLENVLLNLAINARDAMPGGGGLSIRTNDVVLGEADVAAHDWAQPGDYVEFVVADTGTGMDETTRARAFEPFFTTKPVGQGTGLGLSQIYGFMRQSNGIVHLDSAPGQGTAVRLYLPRHEKAEQAGLVLAREGLEQVGAAGRTVLLVEDEHEVRAMTAGRLRELGYMVLEATNGATAVCLLQHGTHMDLLVTDVGLPGGMNGRQVAEVAREHLPGLPVLFITGFAGTVLDGQLAPGMEVIAKPFTFDALAASAVRMIQECQA